MLVHLNYNKYRLFVISILLVFTGQFLFARNYYISNSGDDLKSGSSQSQAWRTLTKLNSVQPNLLPGDSIFLQRGSIFFSSISISKSGTATKVIYIGAYGSGAEPILDGGKFLKNWVNKGNNLYEAICSDCPRNIKSLAINNKFIPLGRYPDTGYLNSSSDINSLLSGPDLSSVPNFNGGEVIIRSGQWVIDRWPVISKSGSNLNYKPLKNNPNQVGSKKYFLQNHVNFLNKDKEWSYDSVSRKFNIYLTKDPSNYEIKVSVTNELLTLQNVDYITVENIRLRMSNITSLDATGDYQTYRKVYIENAGCEGISLSGTHNSFSNSYVQNVQNNVGVFNGDYNTTNNNVFENNCLAEGMGCSGGSSHNGININGNYNKFLNNRIDSCGYNGLSFGYSNDLLIKNNFFSYVCMVKNDGGAIYTWSDGSRTCTNRKIVGNLIMYSGGVFNVSDMNSYIPSEGIYIDDRSTGVSIDSNTVAYCKNIGIYVHNAINVSVTNNLSFGNRIQIAIRHDGNSVNPIRSLNVQKNIFANKNPQEICLNVETNDNNFIGMGVINNNIYSTPFDKDNFIYNGNLNLASWIAKSGQDKNSLLSPAYFNLFKFDIVDTTNLVCDRSFNTGISCYGCHSDNNNCNPSWDNTNKLNGGSMKISFINPTANKGLGMTSNVFPVEANKSYKLSMSTISSNSASTFKYIMRKGSGDYGTVATPVLVSVGDKRKEQETIFNVTKTVSDARIDIELLQTHAPAWVDNIKIQEIKATKVNPDDSLLFVFNSTGNTQTQTLNSCYIDSRNIGYNSKINIPPYTGILLYKKKLCGTVSMREEVFFSEPQKENGITIYPNPSENEFYLKGDQVNAKVVIFNMSGSKIANYENISTGFGSELLPGVYIAKVESENGKSENFKLVKNK